MRRKITVLLLFATGIAAGMAFTPKAQSPPMKPAWVHNFHSLDEMAKSADAVVVAEVVAIDDGRQVPNEPDVPFSNVTLAVSRVLKGEVDHSLVIEAVGDYTREKGARTNELPNFSVGHVFLLFLHRQTVEPYLYVVINNQASYRVSRGFTRATDPEDAVAAQLDGLTLPIAVRTIEEVLAQ